MVEQQKTHENFQQPAAAARDQKKKLLERAYDALRDAGLDQQVAEQRVAWMRGYILFHNKRHPNEMAMTEIQEYYLHAMEGGTTNVRSPLDSLLRE